MLSCSDNPFTPGNIDDYDSKWRTTQFYLLDTIEVPFERLRPSSDCSSRLGSISLKHSAN